MGSYIHTYTRTDNVHLQLTHWTTIRCNSYNVVSQENIPIQEIVSAFPKEINNTQTLSSSSLTARQTHFLSTYSVYSLTSSDHTRKNSFCGCGLGSRDYSVYM